MLKFEKYLTSWNSETASRLSKLTSYQRAKDEDGNRFINEVLLMFYLYRYIEITNTEILKSIPYVTTLIRGKGNLIKKEILSKKIEHNVICLQDCITYKGVRTYKKDALGSVYKYRSKRKYDKFPN